MLNFKVYGIEEEDELVENIRNEFDNLHKDISINFNVYGERSDFMRHFNKISKEVWSKYRIKIPAYITEPYSFVYFFWPGEFPTFLVNLEALIRNVSFFDIEVAIAKNDFELHKGPKYFLYEPNEDWLDLERFFSFEQKELSEGFYLICETVRKVESFKFMLNTMEPQRISEYLNKSLKEINRNIGWFFIKSIKDEQLFMNLLKAIFVIAPLISVIPILQTAEGVKEKSLNSLVEKTMSKVPIQLRGDFKWLVWDFIPRLGYDTFRNIEVLSSTVVSSLVPGVLRVRNGL
ncbi:MAG: hypothetical protein ACTSR0_07190 [Candidatus Asgardarchaeia archaeon]